MSDQTLYVSIVQYLEKYMTAENEKKADIYHEVILLLQKQCKKELKIDWERANKLRVAHLKTEEKDTFSREYIVPMYNSNKGTYENQTFQASEVRMSHVFTQLTHSLSKMHDKARAGFLLWLKDVVADIPEYQLTMQSWLAMEHRCDFRNI